MVTSAQAETEAGAKQEKHFEDQLDGEEVEFGANRNQEAIIRYRLYQESI